MIEAVCGPGDVRDHLAVGTEVVFDDGKLGGVVEEGRNGNVLVRVTQTQRKGFKMKPERGLTFPRADLRLDPLQRQSIWPDLDFYRPARRPDRLLVRAERR